MSEETRYEVGVHPVTVEVPSLGFVLLAFIVQWLVAISIVIGRPQ